MNKQEVYIKVNNIYNQYLNDGINIVDFFNLVESLKNEAITEITKNKSSLESEILKTYKKISLKNKKLDSRPALKYMSFENDDVTFTDGFILINFQNNELININDFRTYDFKRNESLKKYNYPDVKGLLNINGLEVVEKKITNEDLLNCKELIKNNKNGDFEAYVLKIRENITFNVAPDHMLHVLNIFKNQTIKIYYTDCNSLSCLHIHNLNDTIKILLLPVRV